MVGKTALALALFGAFGWTGPMGKGTGSDLAFDSHQSPSNSFNSSTVNPDCANFSAGVRGTGGSGVGAG